MSADDQMRWDAVYTDRPPTGETPSFPTDFEAGEILFPTKGRALDIACGRGGASLWLARRGLQVRGVDVSKVAVEQARTSAAQCGLTERAQFDVVDLDHGLPPGPAVDVVICHRFRAPHLYRAMSERLAAGGVLAVSVLSECDAAAGRYRAAPGELLAAFDHLHVLSFGEARGIAWLIARKD